MNKEDLVKDINYYFGLLGLVGKTYTYDGVTHRVTVENNWAYSLKNYDLGLIRDDLFWDCNCLGLA